MSVEPYKKAKKPPKVLVYPTLMHQPQIDIVGHKIEHIWKDEGEVSIWKGTILEQTGVNPAFYLILYDGRDSVHGLELYNDDRVQGLQIQNRHVPVTLKMEEKIFKRFVIGKTINHAIDVERHVTEWLKGVVLSAAPIINFCHYVTYEKYPILFVYELMDDHRNGQLRIEDSDYVSPSEIPESMVGNQIEVAIGKTGKVIRKVKSRPSLCLIKFKYSPLIHIYQRRFPQQNNSTPV